ncbi:MAG: gliding motility-associated C-terminal domain-containing protein [Bacteroidota bacterium]
MLLRSATLFMLLLVVGGLSAQTPRSILSKIDEDLIGTESSLVCPPGQENFAGTVSLGPFVGQSNDVDLDTMYLCLGDQIQIIHNGDAVLSGDPDGSTPAGIGYAFYDCAPTITGPDRVSIGADPCLVDDPPPADLFYVATEGNLNGDILFFNDGVLIDIFNAGAPALYYFTPITFDALLENMGVFQALYENNGPCVNANVDATIPVVYLTEIEGNNLAVNGCSGSFEVAGGLPQFDNSSYTISVVMSGNPSIMGQVTSGTATHGDAVTIQVPEPGMYTITVEDGKSCGFTTTADFGACSSISLAFPDETVLPGSSICIPMTVDNFTDIVSMQFVISYDPAVVSWTGVTSINANVPDFTSNNLNDTGGEIILSWFDFSFNGVTLANGSTFFELCFDVIGNVGDCTAIDLTSTPSTMIEITNTNGDLLGLFDEDGEICISNATIQGSVIGTDVTCSGDADGSFTVTASDGSVPYNVTWEELGSGAVQGPGVINTQGGTFTASNLLPGTYEVVVMDAGPANSYIDTVVIAEGDAINVIFTETPPLCSGGLGALDAIIVLDSVIIPFPGPEYVFQWSTNEDGQSIAGIPSGLYSVTITDTVTGCFGTGTTFLPQPLAITANVTNLQDATCSGATDGEISIDVTGGTLFGGGVYEIFWPTINGGTTDLGTSSTVTGLADGFYDVIITDDNNCMDTSTIEVGAAKELVLTATAVNDISCNGICDGSIDVSASTQGGTSNTYTFNWFGVPAIPPPGPVNTATSSSVGNLCVGSYTVVLTDDEGCETEVSFDLDEPPLLEATLLDFTNESCSVGNDGEATIGVTGGVFPYNYTWSDTQVDSIAVNLSAGPYTVTVEDANGCQDSVSVTISQPTPPTVDIFNDDNLDCSTDTDGSLTVVATAGGAPITNYTWSNNVSGAGATTIDNLNPGTYFVTITAADGCEIVDSAQVIAPAPLVIDSVTTVSPLCPGDGGGTISIFTSGGTGPFFYDWSLDVFDGISVAVIGGAPVVAGMYSVTITDANGCPPVSTDIELLDPPTIEVDFSNIVAVSCFENQGVPCDGSATATAMFSDGTSGVFNFNWPSGESDLGVVSSTAFQLCQDEQTLTVSDGTCNVQVTVDIPAPAPLGPGNVEDITNVTCFGFADGQATISASGGTAPYMYAWETGEMGPTETELGPGTYQVTVTDDNNCQYQNSVTITQPDPLVAMVDQASSIDSVSCFGEADAVVVISPEGGNIPSSPVVTYTWEAGLAPSNSNTAVGVPAGTYGVTVTDILGCADTVSFTIYEPPPLEFVLADIEEILCPGGQTAITVDTAFGGNGFSGIWYSFSVDNATSQVLGTPINVFAGEHIITVFDLSDAACSADTTVFVPGPPPIILEYPETIIVELGDSVTIQPDIVQLPTPLNEDSVFWFPSTFLTFDFNLLEPEVRPFDSQLYTIEAYDLNGCLITAEVFIEVDKNRNVYIPNIFTPDGDGINDWFQPYTGNGVASIPSFRIYDRWGELVYFATDLPSLNGETPDLAWDGTFNGKKLNSQVFVYLIEVEFEDGERLLYRGDISLMR